jgi:hypothetical protein
MSWPTTTTAQEVIDDVATAILPLPPALREGATVVRLRRGGVPDTIRAGTNPMVCFADTPADTLLDVRCYHSVFVPMIYVARALAGVDDSTLDRTIRQDIEAGRLQLPPFPTAGYRVLGPIRGYNTAANELGPEFDRWQSIHMPFATTSGVGMVPTEIGTEPFMMSAGTWWSHVMIVQAPLRY